MNVDFNNLTDEQLTVARTKCDKSLLFFTRFWYKVLKNSKFILNWHHEEIEAGLEDVTNYKLDLLNINIPPRFSKTEIAGVNYIARGIGMNPSANYLYITASDELRAQTSISIRDIVSHPYFYKMYGVRLRKDQNSKNLWRTEKGGGLKTATIFGQITGFGAGQMIEHNRELENFIRNFEGCIVIDDANKTDDSEVENANNEKVSRTIFNTVMSRKNSKDTPIVNIQQRAGMSDVTQSFIEHYGENNPRARFLVYPVISEDGVPLWDWKHNLQDIEALKTSPKTAHMFETQYMQNPLPKHGLMFPDIKRFKRSDVDLSIDCPGLGFVDVADTGEDNHCVVLGKLIGNKVFIHDVVFTKESTETNVPLTAAIINKYKPEYVRVESNFGGTMYIQLVNLQGLNGRTALIPMNASANKHTRIIQASIFINEYFYFLDSSEYEIGSDYDRFIRNLVSYTKKKGESKHDDAPDCCAGLARMILSFYPHLYESIVIPD
jgi:predicted phage terminase large subunit-like protein